MGPIYMKELAMRIIGDVKSDNPNATPQDVIAKLENIGFAPEFVSELVNMVSDVN